MMKHLSMCALLLAGLTGCPASAGQVVPSIASSVAGITFTAPRHCLAARYCTLQLQGQSVTACVQSRALFTLLQLVRSCAVCMPCMCLRCTEHSAQLYWRFCSCMLASRSTQAPHGMFVVCVTRPGIWCAWLSVRDAAMLWCMRCTTALANPPCALQWARPA